LAAASAGGGGPGGTGAVVQGAYLLQPPDDATPVVRMSCFAFLVKNLVRQAALRRLAGAALLQGSGMAFPAPVFWRIDWSTDSLVEDLDMGLRLVLDGQDVTFEEGALFLSNASSQGGTAGQRRRWEHGMLQSMTLHLPRLLEAALEGRPRLVFLALDQIVPPTVLLLMIAGLATPAAWLLGGLSAPVLLLVAADAALGAGLLAAWLRHGRAMLPPRVIFGAFRYILWKLPIFAQFVTRRQRQWVRTERAP
ncbi:MAG: glycosyltransferase family 2 protein, partial [Sphingobium sp.]